MPDRIAVFLDYHNVYKGAREAFFPQPGAAHWLGQIKPQRLGLKLAGTGRPDRELVAVRVYRGEPRKDNDPKAARAFDRQVATWSAEPLTTVVSRPLNYRTNPPREKGIDVRIAIDFVMMAMRNEYDVGLIFSGDTDLLPALEAVIELKGERACEVATWIPADGSPSRPLRITGHPIDCHRLELPDFRHVEDQTDYTIRVRRR